MSPTASRGRAAARRKQEARFQWWKLWPLLLGIIATPLAVRSASVLALTGPSALRMLYPFLILIQNQAQNFSTEQVETLSQWILWGQFPFYGLLWVVTARVFARHAGPIAPLLLHVGGVGAAIFLVR